MNIHMISETLEWLEEHSKPLFVIAALLLYAMSIVQLANEVSPITELNEFLIQSLANLSIPFGIILLQELLELVANISESNLLSARRQFEIVLLVIIRSFFKKFAKVNAAVDSGFFNEYVQEAVVKVLAIVALMLLIHFFRLLSESPYLERYAEQGRRSNLYKQILVVVLIVFVLINLIVVEKSFDELVFIRLVFTGLIVIEAMFLILSIWYNDSFIILIFESSLVIALIFARFPLFTPNILAYSLSVLGVAFATAILYLMYRVAQVIAAKEEHGLRESKG